MSITINISSFTVNHCRSTIEDNGVDSTIEIQSYVQINSLVGVNSIEEGANLTLQVRNVCTLSHAMYKEYSINNFLLSLCC